MQFEIHKERRVRLTSLRSAGGDWRWQLVDDEGVRIAGGEGYPSKEDCREAIEKIKRINPDTPIVDRDYEL